MLQRKIITLKSQSDCLIKHDYYYALGCELYKKIELYNKQYCEHYHKEGLRKDNTEKNFKLLNPILWFENKRMTDAGISIRKNDDVKLVLSGDSNIIKSILVGFALEENMNIDGSIFTFVSVEEEKKRLKELSLYKVNTMVTETILDENNKKHFIDIMDIRFATALKNNLKRKYKLVYGKEYQGGIEIGIENFETIKKKSYMIKDYRIKGFGRFNIFIKADLDMQKVAYFCGVGSHNMYGSGSLMYIKGE